MILHVLYQKKRPVCQRFLPRYQASMLIMQTSYKVTYADMSGEIERPLYQTSQTPTTDTSYNTIKKQ